MKISVLARPRGGWARMLSCRVSGRVSCLVLGVDTVRNTLLAYARRARPDRDGETGPGAGAGADRAS